jgi:LysM repeat protein
VFDIRDCSVRSIGHTAILIFVTFILGCPHYDFSVPAALRLTRLKPVNPNAGIYHVVKQNERLPEIAKAYNVDLQHLAEVNNLRSPYSIRPDTKIFVPGASQQWPVTPSGRGSTEQLRVHHYGGRLAWPVEGKIISEYGVGGGIQCNGIGIQAKEGAAVKAAAEGQVARVQTIGDYGKVVLIEHADRLVTVYAHLKEIRVVKGQSVRKGDIIGTVGTSGRVETPSLHFEVRLRSKPKNPLSFLGKET